jgi:hypothetical protein
MRATPCPDDVNPARWRFGRRVEAARDGLRMRPPSMFTRSRVRYGEALERRWCSYQLYERLMIQASRVSSFLTG